jgi:hypothetical protein
MNKTILTALLLLSATPALADTYYMADTGSGSYELTNGNGIFIERLVPKSGGGFQRLDQTERVIGEAVAGPLHSKYALLDDMRQLIGDIEIGSGTRALIIHDVNGHEVATVLRLPGRN